MQPRLDVGLRQELEERGDALVVRVRMAGEDPQAGAAGNGVLRRACRFRLVGERAGAVVDAGLHDIAERRLRNRCTCAHSPERKSCFASEVRPP